MAKYRTILLDADNTLFDFNRCEHDALFDALRSLGVSPTEEMATAYSAINDAYWKKLERGEVDKPTLKIRRFADFCALYCPQVEPTRLAALYIDCLTTKRFLIDGALSLCETLSKSCRLYLITNGIESVQLGRLSASPLRPLFADCFISGKIGYEKPHREYFDAVARAIPDFDPGTTLVVGDSLSSDIKGGVTAGLDTCWYNPKGKEAPEGLPITYIVSRLADVIPVALGD